MNFGALREPVDAGGEAGALDRVRGNPRRKKKNREATE